VAKEPKESSDKTIVHGDTFSASFRGEDATSYTAEQLRPNVRYLYETRTLGEDGYTQEGRRLYLDLPGEITTEDEADRRQSIMDRFGHFTLMNLYLGST
jgi:hypothetical protein